MFFFAKQEKRKAVSLAATTPQRLRCKFGLTKKVLSFSENFNDKAILE
jgi:hypothetical protein